MIIIILLLFKTFTSFGTHVSIQESYTVAKLYNVYMVNGKLYCLGEMTSGTGVLQSIPFNRITNQDIVTQYLTEVSGVVPHFKCQLFCTVGYDVVHHC